MSKILITGGAGFIGGHLTNSLVKDGDEVHIVDSFSRGVEDDFLRAFDPARVIVHKKDLLLSSWDDLGLDFDYIVHLAAIIGVRHVLERPYAVLRDNVFLTDQAVRFAQKQKGLKRLLFASTSEVMAGSLLHMQMPLPTPESFPIALTDLTQPRTSYMLSKIYGEAMCNHSGLPFTIIRPHNIYGPRMGLSHVVPELLQKVYKLNKQQLEVASPGHSRAMCYVSDAVETVKRLLKSDKSLNGTFNVGNQNTEITIGELARIIVDVSGKSVDIVFTADTPGSPSRRCPDMTKTIGVTDFVPSVGVADGVRQTFEWYRENVFDREGISAL